MYVFEFDAVTNLSVCVFVCVCFMVYADVCVSDLHGLDFTHHMLHACSPGLCLLLRCVCACECACLCVCVFVCVLAGSTAAHTLQSHTPKMYCNKLCLNTNVSHHKHRSKSPFTQAWLSVAA